MYLAVVLLTMLVLPAGSIAVEHWLHPLPPLWPLIGKWFVFWGVGVRLAIAGVRQVVRPAFTAQQIFAIGDPAVLPIVRELGIANTATGVIGLLSLVRPGFVEPAAIAAAIFYAAAGIEHAAEAGRSRNETIAMVSDLFIAVVLIAYIGFVELN